MSSAARCRFSLAANTAGQAGATRFMMSRVVAVATTRSPGNAWAYTSFPVQWSGCQCELITVRTGLGVIRLISASTLRAVEGRVLLSKTTTPSSLTIATLLPKT